MSAKLKAEIAVYLMAVVATVNAVADVVATPVWVRVVVLGVTTFAAAIGIRSNVSPTPIRRKKR